MTELNEIKEYWQKKYPHVHIKLWNNEDKTKFFALMSSCSNTQTLQSDTIGGLISEGEEFLRQEMMK